MAEDTRSSSREFQLETRHLAGIVVLIAMLCVASFMLGRWVERQAARATAAGAVSEAAPGTISVEDVNKELTYFRTLEEEAPPPSVAAPPPGPREEPVRVPAPADEAGAGEPSGAAAPPSSPPVPARPPGGRHYVPVLGPRDAGAAASLRGRLAARGYRATIVDGVGAAETGIKKVRVGPYSARAEAERAARKIEAEERVRTWIP